MEKALDIGKNIFNKYNQLVLQPNIIASPSVYTFVKEDTMFVVESGANGIMGHSHELYEVSNEFANSPDDAIICFKMARIYLHEHDDVYYIDSNYKIHSVNSSKTINQSAEGAFHIHGLKVREVFKDSIRIFSDYRDIKVISTGKYIFEFQIDEGIVIEHIHDIMKIEKPDDVMYKKAIVTFRFVDNLFHGHDGIYYIEKDNGKFVIKFNDKVVTTTSIDNKTQTHCHNIKLVRVTKRKTKNCFVYDPVPNHEFNEIYHAAKILLQLT
jgi:hypothetical protein